ncbi:MAG TPA: SulP family inorganic anion transporter [Acidobacteriota bacterium]|nr:SulP family inorganic anion transporter [Acidobacteriota bacterium]
MSNSSTHDELNDERRGLARFVPSVGWIADYTWPKARSDGLVAIFVAALLVPQAMAYAQLAGLPPTAGLAAAIVPPFLYALLGTSRYLSIGPVALLSLLTAASMRSHDIDDVESALATAALLALTAGAIQVLIGAARLGFLTNFISDPALAGFINGAALLIASSQITTLLGIPFEARGLLEAVSQTATGLERANVAAAITGVASLAALLALPPAVRRLSALAGFAKRWCSVCERSVPLVVLAAVTTAAWGLNLAQDYGLPVVGAVQPGLPSPHLPDVSGIDWHWLAGEAFAIALIGYVIALGAANSLAGRNRQSISPDQESVALGLGNVGAALTGGYPVGASLSRSAIVSDMDGQSPLGTAGASLIILAVLLMGGPVFAYLPQAALAALIMIAVLGLLDLRQVWKFVRYSKSDAAATLTSLTTVMFLGVHWGLAVGALTSLLMFLWRTSQPRIVVVGPESASGRMKSTERRDVEDTAKGVLVLRVDENLYFANSRYCEQAILREVARRPEVSDVVLDLKVVGHIDASALVMLERLNRSLKSAGVSLSMAHARKPVLVRLRHIGFMRQLDEPVAFESSHEALETLSDDQDKN